VLVDARMSCLLLCFLILFIPNVGLLSWILSCSPHVVHVHKRIAFPLNLSICSGEFKPQEPRLPRLPRLDFVQRDQPWLEYLALRYDYFDAIPLASEEDVNKAFASSIAPLSPT
jgi:hypothetical protein